MAPFECGGSAHVRGQNVCTGNSDMEVLLQCCLKRILAIRSYGCLMSRTRTVVIQVGIMQCQWWGLNASLWGPSPPYSGGLCCLEVEDVAGKMPRYPSSTVHASASFKGRLVYKSHTKVPVEGNPSCDSSINAHLSVKTSSLKSVSLDISSTSACFISIMLPQS